MEVSPTEFLHYHVGIDPSSKRDFSTYKTYRTEEQVKPLDQYRFAKILVCVAHADDESLFAGGLLRKLANRGCEIGVVVCTSVAQTNSAPILTDDRSRQLRRLVGFGRACGMIGVQRTWLLDADNSRQGMSEPTMASDIQLKICNGFRAAVADFDPDVVITHSADGEYGHLQHVVCHIAIRRQWQGPLWTFSADGPLSVQVDLTWKRRLLDCYRYGTTQDAHWSPYYREPGSPLEPWLGSEERFAHA